MDVSKNEKLRERLTPEQYNVCFNKATEPPFTGKLLNNKENGTYTCVCCGEPLFKSTTKFDSGSGWPSFWEPIDEDRILYEKDSSYGMSRIEGPSSCV